MENTVKILWFLSHLKTILNFAAAPELRQKRATGTGLCPEGMTIEECELYAKGKAEGKCARYSVSNGKIHWAR